MSDEKLVYPSELDAELVNILGRPNFHCIKYAELFRAAGAEIPTKAEGEQAYVIHWLVKLYLEHGEDYTAHAQKDLEAAVARVEAKVAEEEKAEAEQPGSVSSSNSGDS